MHSRDKLFSLPLFELLHSKARSTIIECSFNYVKRECRIFAWEDFHGCFVSAAIANSETHSEAMLIHTAVIKVDF